MASQIGWRAAIVAIALAAAAPAAAQVVHDPSQPVPPGLDATWDLELPASWNVEQVTFDPRHIGLNTFVVRLYRRSWDCPAGTTCWSGGVTLDDRLRPGEQTVGFTITGGGRTRTLIGRVRVAPAVDDDHDGMPDQWERREGLEPWGGLATSAPGDDPDGDRVGNIDEFRAGTAPMGRYRLTFGSSSPGERQRMFTAVSMIQPDGLWGRVRVRFVGDDGRQVIAINWPSEGPEINYAAFGPTSDRVLAIEVEAFEPQAAERLLWSYDYGTVSTARPAAPSTEWHFATGPTRSAVDTFLLAYNPGTTPVAATFTYYRSADEAPAVTQRVLPPGRTTVWVEADESALAGHDLAVAIRADSPILMDRGFRRQPPGRTAPQEQVGPGANALATRWYFPRVQGTRDADEQLVLANPGDAPCGVEVAVFGQTREPQVSYRTIAPRSRLALRARDLGVDGLSGVRLTTVTGVPFVAELLQEDQDGRWSWSGPGTTDVGVTWAMSFEPGGHVAIFNPSDEDAEVEAKAWYHPTYGTHASVAKVRVPARRLALIYSAYEPGIPDPPGPFIQGRTLSVRSLPRADGRPGPGIVVGRGSTAGVEGTRNARTDPAIGMRMR